MIDMQTILKDAPPIGFKKDQFTPFGKWLVDSKDRDAHVARQSYLQALDAVEKLADEKSLTMDAWWFDSAVGDIVDALREQIEGGDHA